MSGVASTHGERCSVFTQCSKCETVFRLSADVLRVAGGQVRCGCCGEVFDAVSRLAENATGFTKGESPLFLETRADEILESSSSDLLPASTAADRSDPLDLPPGIEVAQLQFLGPVDDELAAETSLEFTLPPGELDRIFIAPPHPEALTLRPGALPAHPESGESRVATPMVSPPAPLPVPLTLPTRGSGATPRELSMVRIDAMVDPATLQTRAPAAFASALEQGPRARLPLSAWWAAAVLLGALLVIQVVRGNGWLAVHVPLLGGMAKAADLSVYQLRQWGITGDPGAKGVLRVRASIMNAAAELQPYPLLRVTLVNRFGSHVGAREFEPAEYLGHGVARMLAPGERADATLDILDPGKDAEGFELDVCIRNAEKILCAADAAAQAG